jgi:hypothetical protein
MPLEKKHKAKQSKGNHPFQMKGKEERKQKLHQS